MNDMCLQHRRCRAPQDLTSININKGRFRGETARARSAFPACGSNRRTVLKGAASAAALGTTGALGTFSDVALAQDNLRAKILQIPGCRQRRANRFRLAEGRRAVPRPDQGDRQGRRVQGRRALLHGTQQPEPPQLALPRIPEAVGGLYGRENLLDRPRAGRLQPATAAGDRDRHCRLRHPRDGRTFRRRRLRQGTCLGNAGLGQEADRYRRLRRLSEAAGRDLERQDLSRHHRRRLPQFQLPDRRLLRRDLAKAWKDAGNASEWGVPKTWQQVQAVTKFLKGKKFKGQNVVRLSRCAEALGRVRLLFPRQPRHAPMPSIRTTRPGCSMSIP